MFHGVQSILQGYSLCRSEVSSTWAMTAQLRWLQPSHSKSLEGLSHPGCSVCAISPISQDLVFVMWKGTLQLCIRDTPGPQMVSQRTLQRCWVVLHEEKKVAWLAVLCMLKFLIFSLKKREEKEGPKTMPISELSMCFLHKPLKNAWMGINWDNLSNTEGRTPNLMSKLARGFNVRLLLHCCCIVNKNFFMNAKLPSILRLVEIKCFINCFSS